MLRAPGRDGQIRCWPANHVSHFCPERVQRILQKKTRSVNCASEALTESKRISGERVRSLPASDLAVRDLQPQ